MSAKKDTKYRVIAIKNRYNEVFDVEIDGWCFGVSNFPGEVSAPIIFRVVKELAPAFREAIEHNFAFDVLALATRISRAAKYLVDEREIAFAILSQLPAPAEFDDDQQYVLSQIIDQVDQVYGGAFERITKKWKWERTKANRAKRAA